MSHTERGLFVALIVSVTLVLHGCAGADRADPEYESSDTFPMPAGREDAVVLAQCLRSYNHGLGGMGKAQARYGNDIARIAADYDASQRVLGESYG